MCGIIGYVGPRECKPLLLYGLERLGIAHAPAHLVVHMLHYFGASDEKTAS